MLVLVTRPAGDAAATAALLAGRGHAAVVAPVSAIRRTGAALPRGRFDAAAATSRHALDGLGTEPGRELPFFAVGGRTAGAARAAGFRDVRVGAGDASSLADLVRLTLPRPARLLYLAGRDRKPDLEAALAGAGCDVAAAEVYAAEPCADWPAAACGALARGEVGAALHYSRRSLDLALALAERSGLGDAFLLLHHLCLSADAASPLMERRAFRVDVAERPDEAALLARLPAPRPSR